MKTVVLALALAGALGATAAHAEDRPAAPGSSSAANARTASAEAPLGRDGQATSLVCSNRNPNIEYRDCVNAATRDPNAKVRLG
jgi:hypothetical protein